MMSAVDALLQENARLSPSDAEATEAFLKEAMEYVRANMARVGCNVPIGANRVNPTIASEVERALRRLGWRAEFQKIVTRSAVVPGQQVVGYQLAIAPSDEAYAEADRRIREATGN